MLGSHLSQDEILHQLRYGRPLRFKPVGTTSIVYQMLLDAEVNAAFKPASRQHPTGHLGEIAAYRISRCLGLDNVPPAISRTVRREEIWNRLHPDFTDTWQDILEWTAWDEDNSVSGASIYWVPDLRDVGLDSRRRMDTWGLALHQEGTIRPERTRFYSDLSTMLAFDYLVANWDRFSGSNAQGTPSGDRLYSRDHNVAFAAPLPISTHRRVLEGLLRTEKFSRTFVRRLMLLDERRLRAELGRDPGAERRLPLNDAQIRGVMDRREALLSYVISLVHQHGEDRVLVF